MSKIWLLSALALIAGDAGALAQGVAPGGPIGNSTGIGSGLGGVVGGTGPSWPNGTNQAPQPSYTPLPPGGGGTTTAPTPPAVTTTTQPNYYSPPGSSYDYHRRKPSTVPMTLPSQAANVSFLKGCWRTDVFRYEGHNGLTTWCFNETGVGRVLYTRIDQADFSCNAQAQASYAAGRLYLQSMASTCSDKSGLALGDLSCRQNGEIVQCSGSLPARGPGETWSVGLYRVPR
jgi:hypothetical protein